MNAAGKIIKLFALAFPVSCFFVAICGVMNGFLGNPVSAEIMMCWISGFMVSAYVLKGVE